MVIIIHIGCYIMIFSFFEVLRSQVRSISILYCRLNDLNVGHFLVGQNIRVVIDIIIDFNVF